MPTLLVFLGLCCAFAVAVLEVPARNTYLVREKSAGPSPLALAARVIF